MKKLIYATISVLCLLAIITIAYFVKDKVNAASLTGLVSGISLTCLVISFITED